METQGGVEGAGPPVLGLIGELHGTSGGRGRAGGSGLNSGCLPWATSSLTLELLEHAAPLNYWTLLLLKVGVPLP